MPASLKGAEAEAYALKLLENLRRSVSENAGTAAFACSAEDALANKAKGLFSVFMGLENGSPIGEDLGKLMEFYNAGVRYVTLCHSADNQICDSCAPGTDTWNGLSPFGRKLVHRMNEIGMLVDVSHISDKSFYDVMKYSRVPVAATHSCCRSLASHPRNMTDEMIRILASNEGVIQINFYPVFLSSDYKEKMPSYKRIGDHIDHVAQILGNVEHIGLGSDFDGIEITPDGMEDISKVHLVFEDLVSRGYSQEDIRKIAGANFFRIWG